MPKLIAWLMCNSPGTVYVSAPEHMDWADWKGYRGSFGEKWTLEIIREPLWPEARAHLIAGGYSSLTE